MSCNMSLPLGASDCIANYGDPKMLGISKAKTTYANYSAAQVITSVAQWVQEDATYNLTKDFEGLESTPPELVSEQNQYGVNRVMRKTPGMATIHLKTNPLDFNGYVKAFKGGKYYIEIYFAGYKLLSKRNDGTLQGFEAYVTAIPVGMPALDNKIQQYKLQIDWTNVEQFEDIEMVELIDDLADYADLMPLAWDAAPTTAYAATKISYKVWLRGDRSALNTLTPTARIISSKTNVAVPAVTCAAPTAGVSELTITKGSTPVTLASGDVITFVLVYKTGDIIDYTTDEITLKV